MDGEGPGPYRDENPAVVVDPGVVVSLEAWTSKYVERHPVGYGPFGCRAPVER